MKKKREIQKRSLRSRVLRTISAAALIVPAAVLLLLAVTALLPPQRTGSWLSGRLSEPGGMQIGLERVRVNPFGSISLAGVTVVSPAGDTLVSVERLQAAFRFLPLFRRTLAVRSIEVRKPVFRLMSSPDTSAPPETPVPAHTGRDDRDTALPFTLGLLRFDLTGFDLYAVFPDSMPVQSAELRGLCLRAGDIYLPRGDEPWNRAAGSVRLYSEKGFLGFTDTSGVYRRTVNLDLQLVKSDRAGWRAGCVLGLGTETEADILLCTIAAAGTGSAGTLDSLNLRLGGRSVVSAAGSFNLTGAHAHVDMTLDSDLLPVKETALQAFALLPSYASGIEGQLPAAFFRPLWGRISGHPDSLYFGLQSEAVLPAADAAGTMPSLRDGRAALNVSGELTGGRVSSAAARVDLDLVRFSRTLPDSGVIAAGPVFVRAEAGFDSNLLPVRGEIRAGIDSLLGGTFRTELTWTMPASGPLHTMLNGSLRLDSLDITAVPSAPSGIAGDFGLHAGLSADGLSDLEAGLRLFSEGIDYVYADRNERTPPLSLKLTAAAAADSTLQQFDIGSLFLSFNELMTLSAAGSYDRAGGVISIPGFEAVLNNSAVTSLLPRSVSEQLADLTLSGREIIRGGLRTADEDGEMRFLARGEFSTDSVSLREENMRLSVEDISTAVTWQGTERGSGGTFAAAFSDVRMPGLLSTPLDTLALAFSFTAADGLVDIENGDLRLASMGVRGGFRARIDTLNGSQQLDAEGGILFESERRVSLPGGISAAGDLALRFYGRSLDSLGGRFRLGGEIGAQALDVRLDTLMHLSGMSMRLPFRFTLDMADAALLSDSSSLRISRDDYWRNREMYRELMPEIGRFVLQRASVGQYALTDTELDIKIEDGWLEIPAFHTNIMSGNAGGTMRLHFAGEPLSYEITAQAARINAASLFEQSAAAGQETELNAVLQFRGRGIDPAQGIELQGFFNITRIGPRFASTLLQGLDPEGRDRSIRLTRRLLDTGWKPRLFSFEARHGYVYPSLSLDQPWFSPVRLPGKLEFGRLPLEFFLKPDRRQ